MEREVIISAIKDYFATQGESPTIAKFSAIHKIHPASIINKFGSWNKLLIEAGLQPNKSTKRSNEQLLMWLKVHPNSKYAEIPCGIRCALEDRFGSIVDARIKAGLSISDWRNYSNKGKVRNPKGRPTQYDGNKIIIALQALAIKLGRPPKLKDITKKTCGFPVSAVLSQFGTFNKALLAAELPPINSYHEIKKLYEELNDLMINIKFDLGEFPFIYNMSDALGNKPRFSYANKYEDVTLRRSDIETIVKQTDKEYVIYFLVDDSLYENNKIKMICVMDLVAKVNNTLGEKIKELRLKYDEIDRKYIFNRSIWKVNNNIPGL